jgi:hypothetical protein
MGECRVAERRRDKNNDWMPAAAAAGEDEILT